MKKLSTLRVLTLAILLMLACNVVFAQISITATGSNTQDFNTLVTTGSATWNDNSTVANWYAQRTGTGTTVVADGGTNTAGNLYSYGTGTNSDRALGSLGSGGGAAGSFAWGVQLRNNSSETVTNLTVAFTGEQWRNSAAAAQTVAFYYKISGSPITALNPNNNGTWTAVPALNFTSPITGGTAGALDGNAGANRTVISATAIPSLSLAPGEYIMLKWDDPDHTGSDHGLAIDDVTIAWTVPAGPANTSVQFVSTSSSAAETAGTTNLALAITNFSATAATNVTISATGATGRITTFTSPVTFAAGSSSNENCTVSIVNNTLCDGNENVVFTITGISGGQGTAFIGTNNTHTLTITDNDVAAAPVAQAASGVGEEEFTANWDAVSGATGYFLDVYTGTLGGLLAQWTFPTSGAVVTPDAGISANLTSTLSTAGGTGTIGDVAGDGTRAATANTWNDGSGTKYWNVDFSTAGYGGITVSSVQRSSGTGPRDFKLQYRVGIAGTWTDVTGGGVTLGDNWTSGVLSAVELPAECDDEELVSVRWIMTSNTSVGSGTVLNTGTSRIDNIVINATGSTVFVTGYESFDAGNNTSASVTGLNPGTTYFYVVRAEVGGGCGLSANSNEIEVTTDAAIVPELSSTESALDFGFVLENATSATQSFDVSGVDLDPAAGDVNVSVGLGLEYEISLDEVAWSTALDLPYTGGILAATTVFVRFVPTSSGLQSGNITISGGDADDVDVSISGSGSDARIYWNFDSADPTIDVIPDISTSAISRANTSTSTDLTEVAVQSTGYTGASGGANATTTVVGGAFNATTSGYFQWSHVPASGTAVVVTDISFGTRRSTSGPTAYSIRSSADGYSSNVATGTITPNTTWVLGEHNGLNVVGALDQPLTFRIYGHDGSAANNTGAANWRIDDLDILGEAIEPATAYYSRSNGNVNDAIWATTPTGDPGPAIWSPSASMIVQEGDTITVNANTNVDDLTLEANSRLIVTTERLLSVYGNTIELANNSVSAAAGEVELLSFDPVTVTINGLVTFNNLTVATSSGTTVTGTLDIRGTLLLADGDFDATSANVRLRSNATRTGHLGPVGPTADYIGDLTTQRFIPEGVTNWRLLGSAVAGRTVADWNDDFITAGFPGSNYPNFDQPVGSGILWPSVRWYNETNEGQNLMDGLVGVTSIAQELTPGQGFAVWCGDALGGTASFVVDVTGEPTIARTALGLPVTFTDTDNAAVDGWNLVSNPLPSAVDFASLTRGSDLYDGYYIYDPVSGSSASWDADLGISVPEGVLNGVIQSSQAFWLKAGGSDVATTIVESNKVSANTGGVFGGNGTPNVPLIRLTMAGSTGTWSDQAVVAFVAGTPALDVKDAMKLDFAHASAPRIATRTTDGYDLIVNRYGTNPGNITIPVTVGAPTTGTYTITVSISGMDALTCITLEDLLTGTVTPVSDGSVYTFNMDATTAILADRFVLRSSTAMPYSASPALCGGTATGQVAVQVTEGPVDLTLADAFGNMVQEASNVPVGEFIFEELPAGNYTVSVGSSSACGTLAAPVVVLEPFVLEASINTLESTCGTEADGRAELVVLGGEAPYTYLWSNGSTEEGITGVAGAYTALVTDAAGCSLSVEASIPAGPGPEALFETSVEPVLINQPVVFTNLSSPDATYFWDLGDGTSSTDFDVTHSYELPGVYTVVLTVNDGNCASSYTQEIIVQLTTSSPAATAAPFVLNAWSAGDQLIVEHGFDHGKPVQIDVLDATGRLHMQRQVGGTPARVSIPASTLNTGIWFVRVTSGQVQQSFRVPVVR